jgi:hypothetical protein
MNTATNSNIPDYTQWQNLYTGESEHWHDLKRIGKVILPIVLLIFLATLAAVGFVGLHANNWAQGITTLSEAHWFELLLFLIYTSPVLVAFLAIIFVYRSIITYTRVFYDRHGFINMFSLIQRRLLGKMPLPPPLSEVAGRYPFIVIKVPDDLDEEHWSRWLGGPATLVIYDGVALYLEKGGCFSRVVGPGTPPMPFLERQETVKAVVDLRPQVKTGIMKPWTKDGIQVEMEIRMECQVRASEKGLEESQNLVYPFDPIAVKEAVEYTAVKRDLKTGQLYESDWLDGIWGQVTGYLARHISCHSVDEIALAEIKDVGPSQGNLQTFSLATEHLNEINRDLLKRKCGACVTNIHVHLKFPKEVEDKRIEYWKSERDKLATIRASMAEADGIRTQQEAHAKAERDVLDAIIDQLNRVGSENYTESLILSLTGILDHSLDDPLIRPLIAEHSLGLLEKLKDMLNKRF